MKLDNKKKFNKKFDKKKPFQNKVNRKNGVNKNGNKASKVSWKNVKLSGPVISDGGAGLEGLIGLEILENYDQSLVKKQKKIYRKSPDSDSDDGITSKKKPEKKKTAKKNQSDSDSDDSTTRKKKPQKKKITKKNQSDSDSDDDDTPKKKPQKKKTTKKNQSDSDSDDDDTPKKKPQKKKSQSDSDSEDDITSKNLKPTKPKKKKNSQEPKKKQKKAPQPGKFVLLQKPQNKSKANNKENVVEHKSNEEDYNSGLYKKWSELGVSEPIIKALADKCFVQPTEIQLLSIPAAILGRRDILGAAETGSGKTLAFGIPILEGIMKLKEKEALNPVESEVTDNHTDNGFERDLTPPPEELEYFPELDEQSLDVNKRLDEDKKDNNKPLYALILTPTRELAVQIHDHLKAVAKYTNIKIAKVFGGLAAVKQERVLKQCPEIVIATPGRLWELIKYGNNHLNKVDNIKYLVIDETDRMLEKGHFDELKQLLTRINTNREKKSERRNYIFSATLAMVHEAPHYLKGKRQNQDAQKVTTPGQKMDSLKEILGMTDPKVIDITQEHGTAQSLTESRILCKAEQKDYFVYYFLKRHPGRTLIFCNSIDCVKRLSSLFTYLRCDPLTLYGSMIQKQRLRNLEKFTKNPLSVLIATDVAARGLDIPNVEHVIHYQVPKTSENYIHRSGRTARASNEGIAVLMIAPNEINDYLKLHQALGRKEDLPLYPISDKLYKQMKERVQLARDIEVIDLKQRRANETANYKKKVSVDFGSDDSDSSKDSDFEEEIKLAKSRENRRLKARRGELNRMLAAPINSEEVFSVKYPLAGSRIANPITLQAPKANASAITLVQKVVEENQITKKQRNKKRKIQ